MKRFFTSLPWRVFALTGLGVCVGVLTLLLSGVSYPAMDNDALLKSYVTGNFMVVPVNCLIPVLLIWLGYFLTGRGWAAYLISALPCMAVSLVNYYKISLRSDPLLASDVLLAAEAGGIVGGYTLELSVYILGSLACMLVGLIFAALFIPKGKMAPPERAFGLLSAAAILLCTMPGVYLSDHFESKMTNNSAINQWSDVEVFVSRGTLYSFLRSARDMFPEPPAGYDEDTARQVFTAFSDTDIPEEKKVSVLAVMLEAFCDLTDYPALAAEPGVREVYAPWHGLEEQSVHGDLLTNIFAGGTVDSEWGFLTGYSSHEDFRRNTDSFVWYLREQGYQTSFDHPGHGWFYNRQNVNAYLGFEGSRFTENYYGDLVDPTAAIWNSDHILFPALTEQLKERVRSGPYFSFSVSYQNHGPYESQSYSGTPYVTALDAESNIIFNSYLTGLNKTITAVTSMVEELEEMEQPVVLVLFGDHKPWAGNGNSAYRAAGVSFEMDSLAGFENYYSTPYLIWANSAAKAALGRDFVGDGGDFSPCFLMTEVFDRCGWTGSGFNQLQREIRKITPLLHVQGLYLNSGTLTDQLSTTEQEAVDAYRWAEYYRENTVR